MAAVLAGGDGAVLMGPSAAALHGFAPDDRRESHVRSSRRSRPGLRFHRTSLSKNEVTRRHGIPVTTAARTLLDLATTADAVRLERALREALFTRATSIPALSRMLSTHQGERGAGALARAVQEAKDAPGHFRSNKEQRFKNWLRRQRLPLPRFNAEIQDMEVDCYWPQHRLVAEIDDRSTHARRKSFETDRIRDRTLQANGLRVIRIAEPYDRALSEDLRRLLPQ
jgi:very-short-patch-repair endonuclease